MKKLLYSFFILTLVLPGGLVSPFVQAQEVGEVDIAPTDVVHFFMEVKWGNVINEPEDRAESNFDGSISLSTASATTTTPSTGKISLIRKLRFEHHNDGADKITSEADPVSWNSLIYGHWDGAKVLVSSPASANVTVSVTPGSITKTAEEFYRSRWLIVEDVGNGKEIVISTHPVRRRAFIAKILWGKLDREDYAKECDLRQDIRGCVDVPEADFSGSLKLVSDTTGMKLLRPLRFERNDSINTQSTNRIEWTSHIRGGVDGVLVRFILDRDITQDASLTLAFPYQGYEASIPLLKLFHEKMIKDEVKPGYGAWAIVKHYPDRRLIRAVDRPEVYVMEDGLRRHIPNPRVFTDQGLDWNEVEVVEPDEVDVLAEDDPLSYTDGTLIQGDGPEVYVISDDEKWHIRDPRVFDNLKYDWRNVIRVDNAELALYRTGGALGENSKHPDRTLIRFEGEPTVYVIEGDRLKPVTSPQAFASHNFKWDRVKDLKRDVKDQYRIDRALDLADGALVREPSGKVYQVDGGKKRWIRTGHDFKQAGYEWDKVIDVSNEEAASVTNGADVVVDDLT